MKESKGPFTFSINGTEYSFNSLKAVRSFIVRIKNYLAFSK